MVPSAPATFAAPAPTTTVPGRGLRGRRGAVLVLALCAALLAFTLWPRVHDNPRLAAAFTGAGALLIGWLLLLLARGRALAVEFPPVLLSHWLQSSVQLCIYAYWGWYWRDVYGEAPLILAQVVYLYAFEALLSWSRGRAWRAGFGPLPIVLSTNVFIWFKDDFYAWQFALITVGALGKEFIRWRRDGRSVHIFNPSALALSLFSLALLATGTTDATWGVEIATTFFRPPHIYLQIFLLGLIVQYFFSTALMTLSAAAVLYLLNVAYTASTGVYYFLDTNISAAVFLGFHLLVTDPRTSPRTHTGRVAFGALYGVAIWILYWVLNKAGAPEFYDKLLPIPLLNLCLRALDRQMESGWLGRLTAWVQARPPRRANLLSMGAWAALFVTMLATGFVEAPHEGRSIAFWRRAYDEGRRGAGEKLVDMVTTRAAKDSRVAHNALGSLLMEGTLLARDPEAAARHFTRACELGNVRGCANLAWQHLYMDLALPEAAVGQAFDRLEQACLEGTSTVAPAGSGAFPGEPGGADEEAAAGAGPADAEACRLAGLAHETGRGRPRDAARALELFGAGCALGDVVSCQGVARSVVSLPEGDATWQQAADVLQAACAQGDAESCLLLAFLLDSHGGLGRPPGTVQALLQQGCELGSTQACAALRRGIR